VASKKKCVCVLPEWGRAVLDPYRQKLKKKAQAKQGKSFVAQGKQE
jgi:hypothetical protein